MIEVTFQTRVGEVTAADVRRAVAAALEAEKADLHLSVVIVDDPTIHEMNARFLGHDYATDVIAFDLSGDDDGADGEIYVSADTARREARERGIDTAAEILFYCVHGTLHLVGWDDARPADRRKMHERQRAILKTVGIEVP